MTGGMTLLLGMPWCGADELRMLLTSFLGPRISDVHKGLSAAGRSNNLSFHGDAERQCDKAGIKAALSLPRAAPFPTVS